jgi:hypothetical protein
VADYERCGQHCCCQNFLKVLKPISMKSAKIQKATLDPLKISGRCGRLMCCLRYEDATYEELRKRLPKNKTRVGTPEGPGIVVDSKILVQLVLVQLDAPDGGFGREVAVPVEDLMDPNECPKPGEVGGSDPLRGMSPRSVKQKLASERSEKLAKQDRYREKTGGPKSPVGEASAASAASSAPARPSAAGDASAATGEGATKKKRRRRRKKKGGGDPADPNAPASLGGATPNIAMGGADRAGGREDDGDDDGDGDGDDDVGGDAAASVAGGASAAGGASGEPGQPGDGERRKRRRRRKKKRGGGGGEAGGAPPAPQA